MPLSKLNAEQFAAATAPFGHNLIIASAGTGKTSTIVGRIAHLLNNSKAPEEILLLTFTNKAAGEMIDRISRVFGGKIAEKIHAGTFHSVSYKWLKSIDENTLLKSPSELKTLFKTVYDKHITRANSVATLTAAALYDYRSLWENRADDSFACWLEAKNSAHKACAPLYDVMFAEFDELKRDLGFLGFNDLLLRMREKLLNGLEAPFFEALVDEYQDTNPLQNSLLEAIAPTSLFCVGDYDQSIYAFNGAEIEIIASFDRRYPNAKVWTLRKNYRSTAKILDLANRVIANNKRYYPKELEVVKKQAAIAPQLLGFGELFEQYQSIARKIAASDYPKNEIAVIFRNNSSADGIEAMLKDLGIASKRKGSSSFFESKEIKTLLDLMTIIINPRDLLAFIHIMEYAPKIGASSAKELYDAAMTLGDGSLLAGFLRPQTAKALFAKNNMGLFGFEASPRSQQRRFADLPRGFEDHPLLDYPSLCGESAKFLANLWALIGSLRRDQPPALQLEIITASPLFEGIIAELARKRATRKDKTIDEFGYEKAKERIMVKALTLKELSKRYAQSDRFLNAMVLGSSEISEGSGVNLLSVHASKGLEFDEVYVIDLMDGRFPNRKLMSQGGAIEEERRLFYVAVTRARERLFLSFAERDAYKNINYAPSIFLYEAGLAREI
ncbi:MAG: ATP-dependent helicase [Helicobacteraceae bacterium]|jgi:DNA helicase-2/ATP-dependent DNA helicase PcrA|nr:ATP-dependent helicase [Helicobacteraceae bacterium]